ncbi:MAG TPA: IclR family transcriptional regulator [Bryobacteraceae bacterium]|jgi:IclR family acetate operon transcriptional repressor|nr:IclR family transcriptional regulator [Bryobacteraceae bacterium]
MGSKIDNIAAYPMPRTVKRTTQETPSIQSLDRGLVILEAVAKSGEPMSLADLTALLQIDRSSVFRLANTLKRRGFLAISSRGKDYILGPSIWRLSRQYDWSNMLITISHEPLKKLAVTTNETAHLAVREGKHALFIDHATVNHTIAVSGQTGESVPLYCTAHGKALLADCDATDIKSIFGPRSLTGYTPQTITSQEKLVKTCTEIKRQGFATDEAEYAEGIRCVASPIRDQDGSVIASIGISAPMTRFPRERFARAAEQVVEIARTISDAIGSRSE